MRNHWLCVALLAAAAFAAPAASADIDDGGQWIHYEPPASDGSVETQTTDVGEYARPDQVLFDRQLREGVLDQLCRHLDIRQSLSLGVGEFIGVRLGGSRSLGTYPDGSLAVVDDWDLQGSWNRLLDAGLGGGVRTELALSGVIGGRSMVVRRLNSSQSCSEIFRLLNFADIKTVLPLTAERIAAMDVGELWRVPVELGVSPHLTLSDAAAVAAGVASVGPVVTFGVGNTGQASMTLYRLAPDKVRFRFRVERVEVKSSWTGGVEAELPVVAFAAGASNVLLRFFEREAADQMFRYIAALMTYGREDSDGARMIVEFVVDPRDPAQTQALARAMHGDFVKLMEMGGRMAVAPWREDSLAEYDKLRERHEKMLGAAASYAATDVFSQRTSKFTLRLPLIFSHEKKKTTGRDVVTRYTAEDGGVYDFSHAAVSRRGEFIDLPFVGPLIKRTSDRSVDAVTYAAPGAPAGDPMLVYIRDEGFLREWASSVREPLEQINGVLALAGAQRGFSSNGMELPVDRLDPPSPPVISKAPHDDPQKSEANDRQGWMSFALAFDQRAVRDILAAPAESAARAVRAAFGGESTEELSRRTAGVLADLAAARGAATNEERAQALTRMIGGRGRSGLSYEDVMRVLVQFVDPADLRGDLVYNVAIETQGMPKTQDHLVLKGRGDIPGLHQAAATKNRFLQPSPLFD